LIAISQLNNDVESKSKSKESSNLDKNKEIAEEDEIGG
jgi:hypothetical protein